MLGNFAAYTVSRPSDNDTLLVNTGTGESITLRGIEYVLFADGLRGMGGENSVWGNASTFRPDALTGTAGADSIDGGAGNDTITGLGSNDTLIGGTGIDSLIGGDGDDVYGVDVAGDVIVEGAGEGTDQVNVAFTVAGTYVLSANIEHATVTARQRFAANITSNDLDTS